MIIWSMRCLMPRIFRAMLAASAHQSCASDRKPAPGWKFFCWQRAARGSRSRPKRCRKSYKTRQDEV